MALLLYVMYQWPFWACSIYQFTCTKYYASYFLFKISSIPLPLRKRSPVYNTCTHCIKGARSCTVAFDIWSDFNSLCVYIHCSVEGPVLPRDPPKVKKNPFLVVPIMNILRMHTHTRTHTCKCMHTLISILPLWSIVLESGFLSNRIAWEINGDHYIQWQAILNGADIHSLSTQHILPQTCWWREGAPEKWLVRKVSSNFIIF